MIKTAKTLATKAGRASDSINRDSQISASINIYTNAKVREGDYSFSAQEFIKFVNDKMDKEASSLKTEKGRERRKLAKDKLISKLKSKSSDLNKVFALNSALQKCVVALVNILKEVKS